MSNPSSPCTMLLARASWWLLAFQPTPLCSLLDSFPSVFHSLNCTLESHSWTHHRKTHSGGQQLLNLLLLGEKWVRCGFSWTKTHHSPSDDYRFHWWHRPPLALAKPVAQRKQEIGEWETQHNSEAECAPPKPGHEPRPALQHKHALAHTRT